MRIKQLYTGRWSICEDDDATHIIPDYDIQPHSTETEGDSRTLAGMDCPCKPTVITGDADGMYEVPVIQHNSFMDKEYLDAVMSGEIREQVAKQ